MKITLYKYIVNEIVPNFLACLLVLVFVVVAAKMLTITDLIVTKGVPVFYVVRMVCYLLPDIMLFALPAATLISVVLAFLRLSVDSEIIALKSSGISLYQLMPPVAILSVLGLAIGMMISLVGVPWGNSSFTRLLFEVAESKAQLDIKERIFCEPFDGIVFYVKNFSKQTQEMEEVFLSDRRDKAINYTIIADKGSVVFHSKEKMVTMLFQNGTIFVVDNKLESGRTIQFKTYNLNINLKDIVNGLTARRKSPKEMSQSELIRELRIIPKGEGKYNELMRELLEKYSIPLAVFLMGFIGMTLGSQLRTKGRSVGVGVSLAIFIIYYLCLAGMRSICETGAVPPVIGIWIPNVFLLITGIYIMHRVANEKPIHFMFNKN